MNFWQNFADGVKTLCLKIYTTKISSQLGVTKTNDRPHINKYMVEKFPN